MNPYVSGQTILSRSISIVLSPIPLDFSEIVDDIESPIDVTIIELFFWPYSRTNVPAEIRTPRT